MIGECAITHRKDHTCAHAITHASRTALGVSAREGAQDPGLRPPRNPLFEVRPVDGGEGHVQEADGRGQQREAERTPLELDRAREGERVEGRALTEVGAPLEKGTAKKRRG